MSHVEIERKYLLTRLPAEALGHPSAELHQGYIPGHSIHERLRRVADPEGVRHLRTIKLGRGVERMEFEEPVSAELFALLWPATQGRRVLKRRYRVAEGAHVWELDEFLDRDLVLAEVELPRVDVPLSVPPWLAPHVVREVTEEDAYVNLNLAK